jgi:hypothetical protein
MKAMVVKAIALKEWMCKHSTDDRGTVRGTLSAHSSLTTTTEEKERHFTSATSGFSEPFWAITLIGQEEKFTFLRAETVCRSD